MSGLSDLAQWALGGTSNRSDGAAATATSNSSSNNNNNSSSNSNNEEGDESRMTKEELRVKRLGRLMNSVQIEQSTSTSTSVSAATVTRPSNDVEEDDRKPAAKPTEPAKKRYKESLTPTASTTNNNSSSKNQRGRRRIQNRQRERWLQKCLSISLSNNKKNKNPGDVFVDMEYLSLDEEGGDELTADHLTEILASRLCLEEGLTNGGLIPYLGRSYGTVTDEMARNDDDDEFLKEMQKQLVSYTASSLMEPDLFPTAAGGAGQFLKLASDPSMTLFVEKVCAELWTQNGLIDVVHASLNSVMESVLQQSALPMSMGMTPPSETLLDDVDSPQALAALCRAHKGVGVAVVTYPRFFSSCKSGPAMERTLLGRYLKVGLPMEHPAVVSSFRQASSVNVSPTLQRLRGRLRVHQSACFELLKNLCQNKSAKVRPAVLRWIADALHVNAGATALRPDRTAVSSPTFLLNLCAVLLMLAEPILGEEGKSGSKSKVTTLVDPAYVHIPGGVFEGVPRLVSEESESDTTSNNADIPSNTVTSMATTITKSTAVSPSTSTYNPRNTFVPPVFFLTARAIHLGLVPLLAYHTHLARRVGHAAYQRQAAGLTGANALRADTELSGLLALQHANECSVLMPDTIEKSLRYINNGMALLIVHLDKTSQSSLLKLPEHLVDDLCDLLTSVTRLAPPGTAGIAPGISLEQVFRVTVKLLSPQYAHAVRNYNLRAKLGDVLYEVFLPYDQQDHPQHHLRKSSSTNETHCNDAAGNPLLLSVDKDSLALAPSLLLLYGEVEHTGHYEQMGHRSRIASVLRYLWEFGGKQHRQSFGLLGKESFLKFANGIVNETNQLVANLFEKLPEIRRTQDMMRDPQASGWADHPDRELLAGRHQENEQEVRRALPLCNKTLQMLGYLTTSSDDQDLRQLFLLDQMVGRLVDLLMHVLTKLVGSKGLELKIDNPEAYGFRPKDMLRDICSILASFASSDKFVKACARSAFYTSHPSLLQKSTQTCRRVGLMDPEGLAVLADLTEQVRITADEVQGFDQILADAPDEFLDPLLCTYMHDPVVLPTSGMTVDRASIAQHLLNDPHDPFNREDLTMDMVQPPPPEFKQRMDEWLQAARDQHAQSKPQPGQPKDDAS